MWIYEKKLQYPVKIKNPNPSLAKVIISQLGGPDGEMGASMRYLHQRYSMTNREVAGVLTDIGTEGSEKHALLSRYRDCASLLKQPHLRKTAECHAYTVTIHRDLPDSLAYQSITRTVSAEN